MTQAKSIGHVVLALLVIVGVTVPAAAVPAAGSAAEPIAEDPSAATALTASQNNSSVNVTAGQQLSTVIGVTSDETRTDFENVAFEASFEGMSEEQQAEAITERAEALRERAEEIREDYEEANEAYEAGKISKSQYAQRLATLNARATNVLDSYEQLDQRTANVSEVELRAAGLNESAVQEAVENLNSVSGAGPAALLQQFTGQSQGEIELETAGGLKIEITSEDGEQSREIERPRDADTTITVTQSDALETARSALSTPQNGSWVLTEATVKADEGYYGFEFVLRGTANRTGEAEVSVDGSSGELFELEEEIKIRGADGATEDGEDEFDEEDEQEQADEELALVVTSGTPAPSETVTLTVLADGAPAADVTVFLNDQVVGTTDATGTVTVTLPEAGEAELTAQRGDAEGELEFEFEDEGDEEDVFRKLHVEATLEDETATVAVTYNGSGVGNATVYANDQTVGTTGSDGTVTFTVDVNAIEELELEIVKGAFEAELEYVIQGDSLVLTEEGYEDDGDKAEEDAEGEDKDDEEDEETKEDEEDESEEDRDDDDDEEEDETQR